MFGNMDSIIDGDIGESAHLVIVLQVLITSSNFEPRATTMRTYSD